MSNDMSFEQDMEPKVLGPLLRRKRLEAGFTIRCVSEEVLGITMSTYLDYEQGNAVPDSVTLKRLARLYHVPLETFLPDRGENDEQKE